MPSLIPILIATVALATVLNVLLKRFGIPTVIGYIVTGTVIGTIFDVRVHGNDTLEHVAEFGVVFLMFTIGLEFSVEHLNRMKREVFLYGLLQVSLTAAIFAVIAKAVFGIEYRHGLIVGAALALSSTAIVLKILNETGQIKTDFGRNALGILIFQDIAVIPILLMITIVTSRDQSLLALLGTTALNALVALVILVGLGRYALGRLFQTVSNVKSKEIYMGSILMTVIGAAWVAHYFGFSYSLGAFIAGMMIADTIYKYQVEADLIPFRDLLLGVFFVSIGIQIHLPVVLENVVGIVLLGASVMLVKLVVTAMILAFSTSRKTAVKTAVALCQMGEFSLVVFSLLLANDLLGPTTGQIIMVTVVFSMLATPFLLDNAERFSALVARDKSLDEPVEKSALVDGHVVLCGYGTFGKAVSRRLDEADITHVIVTDNTDDYMAARQAKKLAVFGDPADRVLLESVNIDRAMTTVIALDDFDKVKQVSAAIMLLDPDLKVSVQVQTEHQKAELAGFHHELLLDGNTQVASLLVGQIRKSRLLAAETSTLKYLGRFSIEDATGAIELVTLEQARLLDVMSQSFNGLREGRDILDIKAFHDSFTVLSEIISKTIDRLVREGSLTPAQYEQIDTLLNNQHLLEVINESLEALGRELKDLETFESTRAFSHSVVEALDAILLSLKDIAREYTEVDMELLRAMTSSEGRNLSRIRQAYLGSGNQLDTAERTRFLSATNHVDRLRQLFGGVGANYAKLAATSSASL